MFHVPVEIEHLSPTSYCDIANPPPACNYILGLQIMGIGSCKCPQVYTVHLLHLSRSTTVL